MKTQLYRDEDERYTQLGINLDHEAANALRPIFDKYKALGCSNREISHIIHAAVTDCELNGVLDLTVNPAAKKQGRIIHENQT